MQTQLLLIFACFAGVDAARLTRTNVERLMASRSLNAANLPDPGCKSGIMSLAGVGPDPQVCCPKYCGECSDYPTCATKQGGSNAQLAEAAKGASFLQFDPEGASAAACCASKVAEMECGKGAPANVCLKKCSESLPPCIMEAGEKFEMPAVTSAAEDCNEAIPEWMEKAELAVTTADDDGEAQWKDRLDRYLVRKFLLLHGGTHSLIIFPLLSRLFRVVVGSCVLSRCYICSVWCAPRPIAPCSNSCPANSSAEELSSRLGAAATVSLKTSRVWCKSDGRPSEVAVSAVDIVVVVVDVVVVVKRHYSDRPKPCVIGVITYYFILPRGCMKIA